MMVHVRHTLIAAFTALFVAAVIVPVLAHAQETDLKTAIRAAISADARSAHLTSAQLDALATALTTQAQSNGVTAQDIEWKPTSALSPAPVSNGSDMTGLWMLTLFFASMLGLATIAAMMEQSKAQMA